MQTQTIMKKFLLFTLLFSSALLKNSVAQQVNTVEPFDKVIISPHVKVTFVKSDSESVTIENCAVETDKVNIVSKGKTLRVYLDGAKEVTKNEKDSEYGSNAKRPLYTGTVLTVTIKYKTIQDLSVRGEETILFKGKLEQDRFGLAMYGTCKVYMDEVQLQNMHTTVYGESYLEIKSGDITEQKFVAYGESKVNALAINNTVTKATLYGESKLQLNVSDLIKVTSFGDSSIGYKGSPEIKHALHIGRTKIYKIN